MTNNRKIPRSLELKLHNASALVKLVTGAGNNAAWAVMRDGYDHARQCHNYKYQVKQAFKQAIQEWHTYENRLIHAKTNRMFHLDDMKTETRQRFVEQLTDREYYDFWASTGSSAYIKTRPTINALTDKHRQSLEQHGVKDAEHMAWVLTAAAALDIAVQLFRRTINECVNEIGLPRYIATIVFGQFDITTVANKWRRALLLLAPDSEYKLEDAERQDIEQSLKELSEAWLDPSTLCQSTRQSVEDYDEVFATEGYQKKVINEIADVEEATKQATNKEHDNG